MITAEEKVIIVELNEMSVEEQRERVLAIAKEHNWKIIEEDKWNFHIIADNNMRIQHTQFKEVWENVAYWSFVERNGKRFKSNFGTVMCFFVQRYTEDMKVIYL